MDTTQLPARLRRSATALLISLGVLVPGATPAAHAQVAPSRSPAAAVGAGAWAGAHVPARYQAAVDSGWATLSRLRDAEGIPGLSVAVIVDGRTVWNDGMG